MEKLNDLVGYKNRKIYQDTDYFSFTLDSVLLANFVKLKYRTRKILDIGTGTGAIPLILSLRTSSKIDAVEIQKELVTLFNKTIKYNGIKSINIIEDDINNYYNEKNNYYDLITCNPPYFSSGKKSLNKVKSKSRHESNFTISELVKVSKVMLKNKGSLNIVYNAERLYELLSVLNKNNLVPKRLMFVHENIKKEASMVLVECIKNGKPGVKIESPIILKNIDKTNTKIYDKILSGGFLYESKKL